MNMQQLLKDINVRLLLKEYVQLTFSLCVAAPENISMFFNERVAASEKILMTTSERKNVQLLLRITST